MLLNAFIPILLGIIVIWISAERLERYSVATALNFGLSPFLIGSTVIAFGTSAPEMLTTFFAALEAKGTMIIGNVIGSNVANLSLVFGATLLVLSIKKLTFVQEKSILKNLIILLISTGFVWLVISIDPFSIFSSLILLLSLLGVIFFWYVSGKNYFDDVSQETYESYLVLKLVLSLFFLVLAAWLITFGAMNLLTEFNLGEMIVGYTVLAIGTSLPEIAASTSLALKGRYETVAGTLIGSNIFNGLCVLAIPGLFNSEVISNSWNYKTWEPLLAVLLIITLIFCGYIYSMTKKNKTVNLFVSLVFLSAYFLALSLAY